MSDYQINDPLNGVSQRLKIDLFLSKLFALREDKSTGNWTRSDLCMGESDMCTGDLVGVNRARFVLSFGEDEDGELYVLTSSSVSTASAQGVVYQIVDPARQVYR